MAENNSVLVVAVLAVIASLAAAGFSYYAMTQGPKVSGFLSYDASGTASLTVEQVLEIEFTDAAIAWGSGRVNTGSAFATLDSGNGAVTDGSWTPEDTGLTLENKGNLMANITLTAGKTAATLLGGTSPSYQWKVNSTACATTPVTAYTNVGTNTSVCTHMAFADADDTLRVDVKLVVPQDSLTGALSDTITAIASVM